MTLICKDANISIPGNLFIISAPSGAGKSSLVKALMANDSSLALSTSHTTRAPRGQEENGVHYWFVEAEKFQQMIDTGDFLEWAQVHGNRYGTSKHQIMSCLQNGQDIILEIDWQGALQIHQIYPQAVLIFIVPPSLAELENRLRKRGEDSHETIEKRLNNAKIELAKAKVFDFVIINDIFETALSDLQTVVHSQRLRYSSQQYRHADVFKALHINQD